MFTGIIDTVFFAGTTLGLAYGIGAGTIRSDADVVRAKSLDHRAANARRR